MSGKLYLTSSELSDFAYSPIQSNLSTDAWVIGYLSVVGSFNKTKLAMTFTSTNKKPLEVLLIYFNLSCNINFQGNSYILNVYSPNDIITVVNKLNNNQTKFVGIRHSTYLEFLKALRSSPKFS